ncbi:MAG: glycosyltransferase [Anaerolineaceae bacterium]|nr:glycosyltransferase [Anaerolineaceae bacterium]
MHEIPIIRLTDFTPQPAAIDLLPISIAQKYAVFPLCIDGKDLCVAMADPANRIVKQLQAEIFHSVRPFQSTYSDIRAAWGHYENHRVNLLPDITPEQILYRLGHQKDTEQAVSTGSDQGAGAELSDQEQGELAGWLHYLPHFDHSDVVAQPSLSYLVPQNHARQHNVVPLWWSDGVLYCAIHQAEDTRSCRDLSRQLDIPVLPVICALTTWNNAFRDVYLHGQPKLDPNQQTAEILLAEKAVSAEDLAIVQRMRMQTGEPLKDLLFLHRYVTPKEYAKAQSEYNKLPRFNPPDSIDASPSVLDLIPNPLIRDLRVFPFAIEKDSLILLMEDYSPDCVKLIETITGYPIEPQIATRDQLNELLALLPAQSLIDTAPRVPQYGRLLLAQQTITREQLNDAVSEDFPGRLKLGERLIHLGYLDDCHLAQALSIQSGIPYAGLAYAHFDENLVNLIDGEIARNHLIIPLEKSGDDLWTAVADPYDFKGIRLVEEKTGMTVHPIIAPRSIIIAVIERYFDVKIRSISPEIHHLLEHLVEQKLIDRANLGEIQRDYTQTDTPLDIAIKNHSHHPYPQILETIANHLNVPVIQVDILEQSEQIIGPLGEMLTKTRTIDPVDTNTARMIDIETAQKICALPIRREADAVLVAFASPNFELAKQELEQLLDLPVRPALTVRDHLNAAITRNLGWKTIGDYLLLAQRINRRQLNQALTLGQKTGVRIGQALVNLGYIKQTELVEFLAEQSGLEYVSIKEKPCDPECASMIPPRDAAHFGLLPIEQIDGTLIVATVDPFNDLANDYIDEHLPQPSELILVSEEEMAEALEQTFSDDYLAISVSELLQRTPLDSAYHVLSNRQKVVGILILLVLVVWLVIDYHTCLIFLNILSTIFYLGFSIYKFYLVYRSMSDSLEVPVSEEEIKALDDRDLPIYTILIPVYKEKEVLRDLMHAISKMDYPTTKLDVKILLEADDTETIETFYDSNPPAYFEAIVVPYALPKTKPKACNYGLIHARGEYCVIFDAEDLPEPDQLKRILVAFSKSDPDVICIQSKLNYFNSTQNILTRWFTAEYSMWFDLFLPGLANSHAPIPLGGTSNHFKTYALIEAGAWDPYNVTEDADLGIRLFKRGYKTAIVDTTTYEEANSQFYNWIRQRSRWIKGYMQTWLVHMRNPIQLIREIGLPAFLSFQLVIGGTWFSALMNPVYWLLTTIWFFFEWEFIHSLFPNVIFYFGAICLLIGNFAFTYMNVAGALRRKFYGMVKYALISPMYWSFSSIAAWKGFYQLIVKPHFWEKTIHGLHQTETRQLTALDDETEPEEENSSDIQSAY